MNQDKKNYIREKCIEANPEIVELKFGCLIRSKAGTEHFIVSGPIDKYPYQEGDFWTTRGITDEGRHQGYILNRKDISEIIGHPVRLADVLLAIGSGVSGTSVDATGQFMRWNIPEKKDWDGYWAYQDADWNLRDDDLEKQSPETVEFLYSLLQ